MKGGKPAYTYNFVGLKEYTVDAANVGVDEGTNASSAYKQHDNRFTGKIEKVRVDVMYWRMQFPKN